MEQQKRETWRFARDPWMAGLLQAHPVRFDALNALDAWARVGDGRTYTVLSAPETLDHLEAVLAMPATDPAAASDLGRHTARYSIAPKRAS